MRMSFGNIFIRANVKTSCKDSSTDDLLDRFKTENWNKLDNIDKLDTLQELEQRCAKQQKRPAALISEETNPDYDGAYNGLTNTVKINLRKTPDNSSYNILDSYYHESEHAQQTKGVKNTRNLKDDCINCSRVEMARERSGTFFNYNGTGASYDIQACEMDSNNFAAKKMLSHKDRFGSDSEYLKFLKGRWEDFSKVNKSCNDNRNLRTENLENGLEAVKDKKLIGKKQYNAVKSSIQKVDYGQDSVLLKSQELEDVLKQEISNIESNEEVQLSEKHQQFFKTDNSDIDSNADYQVEEQHKLDDNGKSSINNSSQLSEKHDKFFSDDQQETESAKQESSSETSETIGESKSDWYKNGVC